MPKNKIAVNQVWGILHKPETWVWIVAWDDPDGYPNTTAKFGSQITSLKAVKTLDPDLINITAILKWWTRPWRSPKRLPPIRIDVWVRAGKGKKAWTSKGYWTGEDWITYTKPPDDVEITGWKFIEVPSP